MSFECDAFISYSHIDNIGLIDGSKGWITNLHRALEIRIAQLLGEKPNLWRDPNILVVEGRARILYGDKTFDAAAGTMVSLARAVPHAWGNPTKAPNRLAITATPGGCEEALRLIATSRDQLDLRAIAEKFAVRQIGPPLLGGAKG
jgi:hypothetical protein